MFWRGQPPAPPLSHFLRWGRWGRGLPGGLGRWQPARLAGRQSNRASAGREDAKGAERGAPHHALPCPARVTAPACPPTSGSGPLPCRPRLPVPGAELAPQAGSPVVGPGSAAATGMTDVLPQPDCSLKAVCEPLERCCLDPLEEPGSKRPPNTGARLWGRVRSKLLRQKVREGAEAGGQRGTEVAGGCWAPRHPLWGAHCSSCLSVGS